MTNQPHMTLPIAQLQSNPFQPREKIQNEEIVELVESKSLLENGAGGQQS